MSKVYEPDGDFKVVSCKRKKQYSRGNLNINTNLNLNSSCNAIIDKDIAIRRIKEAEEDLLATDFFDSIFASLQEGITILNDCKISEIICLGLGRIGECIISRYQFALLLCLKKKFEVQVSTYDPIFSQDEKNILEYFDCQVLTENLEGKYKINDKKPILFYLPHCPKQLTNNLLWANWGLNLAHCIIISNSFNKIIENTSKRELEKKCSYISNIFSHTVELAVVNSFKYYEVFNDIAIHIFPWNKLNLISDDLWTCSFEPKYLDQDIEFITDNFNKIISKS